MFVSLRQLSPSNSGVKLVASLGVTRSADHVDWGGQGQNGGELRTQSKELNVHYVYVYVTGRTWVVEVRNPGSTVEPTGGWDAENGRRAKQ